MGNIFQKFFGSKRVHKTKKNSFKDYIDKSPSRWEMCGVKGNYLVVKTAGKRDHLIDLIKLNSSTNNISESTNWRNGIEASYASVFTFVSPEENDYCIIPMIYNLGDLKSSSRFDYDFSEFISSMPKFARILINEFNHIALFGSHRVVGYGFFVDIRNGDLHRAYEYHEENANSFGLIQEYEQTVKKRQFNEDDEELSGTYENYIYGLFDAWDVAEICASMTGIDQLTLEKQPEKDWQLGTLIDTENGKPN